MAKETAQRPMRLGLGHPVQVERTVDRRATSRKLPLEATFDRRERQSTGLGRVWLGSGVGLCRRRGRRLGRKRL
jgi:hypothetical protein